MTVEQQIDYMIQSLQIAKDELRYARKYYDLREEDNDFYNYGHFGNDARKPNGTIIRESLKMTGRMANIAANKVGLSNYNEKLFKE